MGREWYWSRSSLRRGESRQSPGCMAHVLQLFDLHPVLHTKQEQPPQDSVLEPIFHKGVEAPRNSLELEERSSMAPPSCSSSSSSALKDEEDYYIPFSVQLPPLRPSTSSERASRSLARSPSPSSEPVSSSLPQGSSKTPSVVARLMGLELLPLDTRRSSATSSPVFRRPSARRHKGSSSATSRHESGTRSLPDTPRISSARRSDVDHRLSLQLNKENVATPEFDYGKVIAGEASSNYSSPPLASRRAVRKRESRLKSGHDELRSPGKHVAEIVKQVKDSVGRRVVGADITNISSNRKGGGGGDGEKQYSPPIGHLKKARRSARAVEEAVQTKHTVLPNPSSACSPSLSSSSLSPRTRIQELAKNRTQGAAAEDRSVKPLKSPPPKSAKEFSNKHKSSPQSLPKPAAVIKCRKASCERFTSKPRRSPPPPDSSPCLRRDVKKWQVERKGVVQSKEDRCGRFVSSEPGIGQPYDGPNAGPLGSRDDNTVSAEFQYLRAILELVGIEARGTVSAFSARWYSPAHPLDPALFYSLERSPSAGPLRPRPTRRLFFHLADELLSPLLRPHLHLKPWLPSARRSASAPPPTGAQLLDRAWARVRGFPRANCQTLQDIDELVGSDLPEAQLEEEWEAVAGEIERWILDSLVDEAAACLLWPTSVSDC